jgi:hypothetical protein
LCSKMLSIPLLPIARLKPPTYACVV